MEFVKRRKLVTASEWPLFYPPIRVFINGLLWRTVRNFAGPVMIRTRPCSYGRCSLPGWWWLQHAVWSCLWWEGFVSNSVFFMLLGFAEAGGSWVMGAGAASGSSAAKGDMERNVWCGNHHISKPGGPPQAGLLMLCFLLMSVLCRADSRNSLVSAASPI